ncbi:MAG: UDP-3-O-acyl-N-acetylglucosamine deacetylase [Candidatus Omnitrophica bacterium]|nr:UDP-3-O-acyl-N-acetylglucosamine deacetylase [Candidatus Omnitrophota bacterium]
MDKQCTIKDKVCLEGIGLHTGKEVKLELLPAPPNSGIIFVRKDIIPETMIRADIDSVLEPKDYPRRTSINYRGVFVHTIEHLMASLHLLSIDNLIVNIWGEEVPGMDGSAKEFVENIGNVGIDYQDAPKRYLTIKEPLWAEENSSSIVILPYPVLRVSYTIKYDNSLINTKFCDVVIGGNNDINKICEARTFCLEEEVESLIKMGMGKGSNYTNTLVVSEDRVINNKLRSSDEFVKHKVLDLLGDLYLAGPLKGHIIALKSGHILNIKLLHKIKRYREKMLTGGVGCEDYFSPMDAQLSIEDIKKILPHRYPFLLIDRVIYMDKGKKAIGIKNVTVNDYFFQGHFPKKPVMPGVLIIEAMAQLGGVLMLADEENRGKLAYFMCADKVKFRKTVEPGDQLVIEVNAGKIRRQTGVVFTKAFVNNKLVAEAELMFALVEP